MDPCRIIISDLKENKNWISAFSYSLFDKPVVLARQYHDSSIVVIIPLTSSFPISDLNLYLDRGRQLALDICSDKVNLTQLDDIMEDIEVTNTPFPKLLSSPDIFHPQQENKTRFIKDIDFTPNKCQKIHNDLMKFKSEFDETQQKDELAKHKADEIRLGLNEDGIEMFNAIECDHICSGEDKKLNDFYLSVIFALMDGPMIAYYQGAPGLAPPFSCPDDSDDEKPIEVVWNEQKKLKKCSDDMNE